RYGFEPEAIELEGPNSYHIINYNSPGATGSPAYTANLAHKLEQKGHLAKTKKQHSELKLGNFYQIINQLHSNS
ncbi:MAG: hypothetical protein ACE5KO_02745, partial [Candidatus Bathyarchaeia archaeon]